MDIQTAIEVLTELNEKKFGGQSQSLAMAIEALREKADKEK